MTRSPVRKPTRRATPAPRPQTGMALHTLDGARKYLTTGERDVFLRLPSRPTARCGCSA